MVRRGVIEHPKGGAMSPSIRILQTVSVAPILAGRASRFSRLGRLCLFIVLALGSPGSTAAQTCFRGHPKPACSGFTILELTGALRLNEKPGSTDGSTAFFYWSGGYLRNIGARSALGPGFKLTADSDGHRYGPVLRYRRWLSPTSSIDFAPGAFVAGKDNFVALRFPSPTADVAVNYRDWVGLAVGVDALRPSTGATQWQWHAGMRVGTWLAPVVTLGLFVLAAATY